MNKKFIAKNPKTRKDVKESRSKLDFGTGPNERELRPVPKSMRFPEN